MDTVIALIALAGGLGRVDGRDLVNVIYGVQSVRTARLTGYTREAEYDADATSAVYTYKAGYDPLDIVWFLDRLIDYQEANGEVRDLGIFQTHPPSPERLIRIANKCAEMGVDVDFREIEHLAKANTELSEVNGRQIWTVTLAGRRVCVLTDDGSADPQKRAEETSEAINALLEDGLVAREIRTDPQKAELIYQGKTILKICASDANACGVSVSSALDTAADALRYAVWSDWVKTITM